MEQRDITTQAPLEYWLKHADEAMTRYVNNVLEDYGFPLSRWQVLNNVYEAGSIIKRDVFETMKTFTSWFDEIVDEFVKAGWLVKHGDGDATVLVLTETGKTEYESILTLQHEVRKRAFHGITEQQHTTVIETLQRLVQNLE